MYNKLLEGYLQTGNVQPYGPLKQNYSFLSEVDSLSLDNSRLNLVQAVKNYKSKKAGKPKFKSKKNAKQSYKTNNVSNSIRFSEDYRFIRLPKLGFVRVRVHRKFDGIIKSAIVTKTKSGKYFVTVLFKTCVYKLPKAERIVGIDLGLTALLRCKLYHFNGSS